MVLSGAENQLLPMIHKMWQCIVQCLRDDELVRYDVYVRFEIKNMLSSFFFKLKYILTVHLHKLHKSQA